MKIKINIILFLSMSFAILAWSAGRASAVCSQDEINNYECSYDENHYFEVRVETSVGACSDDPEKICTTYEYTLTKLPAAPHEPSHFNLIVERPFADLIVGGGLDCDGSGDPSSSFAKYQTWNCYYKWNELGSGKVSLEVKGETDSAPTDWFIKASNDSSAPTDTDWFIKACNDPSPYAWGIIKGPATSIPAKPLVIAKTSEEYSYIDRDGNPYTVTIYKDQAGNITQITRTHDGIVEDITDSGVPIEEFQIQIPDGDWENLEFITDEIVTKTGENSTCAYWYRGKYYNFCR